MNIALIFLPLYFGLIVGVIGRNVWLGLAGAIFGVLLALLLRRERPRAGMTAIDGMSGVEFEGYVAARLRRAGWQVRLTPAVGDYGVDLIAEKDGQSVAIQCKRHSKSVGVAAVQQVVSGALHHGCTPPRLHEKHRREQPGVHYCRKAIGLYPSLPIDWAQSIASLGTTALTEGKLATNRRRRSPM